MGNIIKVSKSIFSSCKTIKQALELVKSGDTIQIGKGVYNESFVITKSITLRGEPGAMICGMIETKGFIKLSLIGVTIENITEAALQLRNAHLYMSRCTLSGNLLLERLSSLEIDNSVIHPSEKGVALTGCFSAKLIDTTICDGPKQGLVINKGSVQIDNCMLNNKLMNIHVTDAKIKIDHSTIHGKVNVYSSELHISNTSLPKCYSAAIYAYKQSEAVIEKCTISDGFIGFSESTGKVTDTQIQRTTFIQKGITIHISDVEVTGCEIKCCNSHGILITKHSSATVTDCHIHDNKEANIRCSQSSLIVRNSKLQRGEDGLFIDQSHVEVMNSEITDNRSFGIYTVTQPSTLSLLETKLASNTLGNIQEGQEKIFFTLSGYRFLERDLSLLPDTKVYESLEEVLRLNPKAAAVAAAPAHKPKTPSKMDPLLQSSPMATVSGFAELQKLIGLTSIKKEVGDLIKRLEFNKELTKFGLSNGQQHSYAEHLLLYGNPGTGKTTVARIMGQIYKELGLLEKGHVVQVNREKLVGQHIGSTAPKTQEKIDEAMGGVLFIDEAYSLTNKGSAKDFGPEAIEVILEAMENHRGKFVVIAAGYELEMQQFLEVNPGLQSRFTQIFQLEDYTPEEMLAIAEAIVSSKQRMLHEDAKHVLVKHYTQLWRQRDKFFSNARLVRNDVDRMINAQMKRCMNIPAHERTREKLQLIIDEDVKAVMQGNEKKLFNLPINEALLTTTLEELNQLIGLDSVKSEIQKLVTLTRYYKEEDRDLTTLSNHIVLTGNPGTGKTVVARLIAKIYEALGIVERGDLVEVSRDQLVGTYSGETEKNTADVIEKAMSGTLFIDEAYQLTQYGASDNGHKVIEVLLKYMEDYRGKFNVIVAGYPAEMEQFLGSNAGLQRRFVHQFQFEDYAPGDLIKISQILVRQQGYQLNPAALDYLQYYYTIRYERRDRSFGNAGMVRNDMLEAIKNVDYRIAKLPREQRSQMNKNEITVDDLNHMIIA